MGEYDYKPNSHKYKREQEEKAVEPKKIEKVVNGTAKTKKKSEIRKFTDIFFAEDFASVKEFLCNDILIPSAKKLVYDIFTEGLGVLLNGKGGMRGRGSTGSRVTYSGFFRGSEPSVVESGKSRTRFDYDDILFESRGEAEAVLTQMDEVIAKYGFVTVADMYDMADLTQPYTSNRYGWSSVRTGEVVRVSDGYIIKLPKATVRD